MTEKPTPEFVLKAKERAEARAKRISASQAGKKAKQAALDTMEEFKRENQTQKRVRA